MTDDQKIDKIIELFDEAPDHTFYDSEFQRRLHRILRAEETEEEEFGTTNEERANAMLARVSSHNLPTGVQTSLRIRLLTLLDGETAFRNSRIRLLRQFS